MLDVSEHRIAGGRCVKLIVVHFVYFQHTWHAILDPSSIVEFNRCSSRFEDCFPSFQLSAQLLCVIVEKRWKLWTDVLMEYSLSVTHFHTVFHFWPEYWLSVILLVFTFALCYLFTAHLIKWQITERSSGCWHLVRGELINPSFCAVQKPFIVCLVKTIIAMKGFQASNLWFTPSKTLFNLLFSLLS